MAEMTGNVAVGKRGDAWTSKRVFFLTPQVVENLSKLETFPQVAEHVLKVKYKLGNKRVLALIPNEDYI